MQHSGTTFLSKLLTAHRRVNAAFECGILSADSPTDIPEVQPWADWFTTPIDEGHWGLTKEQFAEVAAAKDWNAAYERMIAGCPLFREGEDLIVDKSPAYLQALPEILAKVPGKPCLVLEKDALLTYHSYKRRDFPIKTSPNTSTTVRPSFARRKRASKFGGSAKAAFRGTKSGF